ncbi:dihydroorotase family protein [Emticicia sp. BO119]|uniref:dihydroorotase n=1 Tax=Emticicia sp. BO119 TaxID=2757768 RepID=UPI0015F0D2C9|nr:dihydroorotase [Emticicia sp. BO119]MBA4850032.1 dihydroorotase [Emticicia sp. BO119]
MKTLLKSVKIIDRKSDFNGQIKDILIIEGKISKIADKIEDEGVKVIEGANLHVSTGWIDMRVSPKDPGYESKEDLTSLCRAAAAGGFTKIVTLPNTRPTVQTKESIAYYKGFSKTQVVDILPAAAITKNCEGKDFTEMLDLHNAGAIAFTDGEHPLWNADILLKTLQYLYPINGFLMNRPEETTLTLFGQMHEGIESTLLGMKGIPSTAEELIVMRDLKLLEYAFSQVSETGKNAVLHFSTISTKRAVELIREAKVRGLPVSCDIAAHQLAFTDADLKEFDTNLKVNPPFREINDIEALQEGLADGTIDVIVSDHNPQDEESKNLEFDMADFGIIGLETSFGVANTYSKLSVEALVDKLTINPAKLLRLSEETIKEGEIANITIFNPDLEWTFMEKDIRSKAKNTPFVGRKLRGKVIGIINKNQFA